MKDEFVSKMVDFVDSLKDFYISLDFKAEEAIEELEMLKHDNWGYVFEKFYTIDGDELSSFFKNYETLGYDRLEGFFEHLYKLKFSTNKKEILSIIKKVNFLENNIQYEKLKLSIISYLKESKDKLEDAHNRLSKERDRDLFSLIDDFIYNSVLTDLEDIEETLNSSSRNMDIEDAENKNFYNYNDRVIIQWNEQKNVLTDIFQQLKQIRDKRGEHVIGNSVTEIALFLKQNFSCFNDSKLSTIEGMLKNRKQNPNIPKTDRRIIIEKGK